MINQRQQRGLSMIGLLFWGIVIVFVALIAMKLIPAYTEFFTIQKILKDISNEPSVNSMGNAAIREKFEKRAKIDNITVVKSTDLDISRDSGQTVLSVEYSFLTPLVGNISLLVDFSASTDSRESKQAQQIE